MKSTNLSIPTRVEDVDAAWMTQALARKYPGTQVTNLVFGTSVRATGTKVRLLLEYNDAGHRHRLPPTMWFKGGLEAHSDAVRTSHVRESLFYDRFGSLGLVNAPGGYFGGVDGRGYAAQLIEDLLARNARFGTALRPLSVDQAAAGLEMLARLHAYWWNAPDLDTLGPPGGTLASDGIVLRLLTNAAWEGASDRTAFSFLPAEYRSVATVRAAMERLWANDRESAARCIVHGDPHPGNLFFDADGRIGFLDWQRLMQCDWAHDINYFLVSSMDVAAAEQHEADLLAHYLAVLKASGVSPPGREAAWRSYRAHTAYGLVWNVVPPAMQTEAVCATVAERFNAAAARHDLRQALG